MLGYQHSRRLASPHASKPHCMQARRCFKEFRDCSMTLAFALNKPSKVSSRSFWGWDKRESMKWHQHGAVRSMLQRK